MIILLFYENPSQATLRWLYFAPELAICWENVTTEYPNSVEVGSQSEADMLSKLESGATMR